MYRYFLKENLKINQHTCQFLTERSFYLRLLTMESFRFLCHPEILAGDGAVSLLPEKVKALGGRKVLLVADPFLARTGKLKKIQQHLSSCQIQVVTYDSVTGEPTTEQGDACGQLGREENCNLVVGIGGGSVLDTAKAAAILITNGGSVKDYQGLNKVPEPGLPTIMVPTTAGTGSEVTFTAVFVRKQLQKKAGINSPFLYPTVAILDAELTLSLPPAITSTTGLDALCHAVESYLSRKANFLTEIISCQAANLIWKNLPVAFREGSNIAVRRNMLYGSFLAGLGLANAGVTAVHAISYPLGGIFGMAHGLANGLLLPYVLEFNLPAVVEKLGSLAKQLEPGWQELSLEKAALSFVEGIKNLLKEFHFPGLKQVGVCPEIFPRLAEEALKVSVPIQNNPRDITASDIVHIYESCWQ